MSRAVTWDQGVRGLGFLLVAGLLVRDLVVDAGTRDRARAEAAAERTRAAITSFVADAPAFRSGQRPAARPTFDRPEDYGAALAVARAEQAWQVTRISGPTDRLVEHEGEEWLVVARPGGARAAVRWDEVVDLALPRADALAVRSERPVPGAARLAAIAGSPPIWVVPRSVGSGGVSIGRLFLYAVLVTFGGSLAWDAWRAGRERAARVAGDAARDGVLARLSHELRTPAASVRALVEALASGAAAPEDQARFLSLALVEADRLAVGVDRLLRAARGEAAPPADPVPLDLAEWGRATAERWSARLPGLTVSAPGPCPATADPDRLDEAVDALLDNAARYGGPNVTLTVGPGARFSVEDDGPGVPAAHRARIFERLYRVERGPGDPGGHGLGLWVVAEVAKAHGGRATLVDGRFLVELGER